MMSEIARINPGVLPILDRDRGGFVISDGI